MNFVMKLDFTNKNLYPLFELFGEKLYITETMVSTWIVMGVLILLAIVVRIMLPRFKEVPTGFQNVIEFLVDTMDSFAISNMGPKMESLGGVFFGIFAFILLSNLSGLWYRRPPTADLSVTAALAAIAFVLIHGSGIINRRIRYLDTYFSPNPVLFPINLIGEISKPISLCFRLLGNMMGGYIIIQMVYGMLPTLLQLVWPAVLHGYFDIFAGSLQAFIFTILTMTFISEQVSPAE